ncbi:MAG: radical SAM protein [Candidatus Omnitrophota bacterium]
MKNYTVLLDEFKHRKINLTAGPACFYIESVQGCPYSCAMCPTRFTKPQKVSDDLLKRIEPSFKELEILAIHGSGEPLLGDISYFVDQSLKHDFIVHMNTTGFFLTKTIADTLLKARLSIRFSIHAGKSDTYKKIMGNKFEKALENIAYLVRKNRENDRNADLWFSFIVMKENLHEIDEFLKIAHDIGVERVRFMKLEPNSQSLRGIQMPDRAFKFNYFEQWNSTVAKEFFKSLPHYKKLASDLNIKIVFEPIEFSARRLHFVKNRINMATQRRFGVALFPLMQRRGICAAPWLGQLIIRQNGDVALCCGLPHSLGNIKHSTLREIWNSEEIKKVRESFRNNRFPRICRYCRGMAFTTYPLNSFFYKLNGGK